MTKDEKNCILEKYFDRFGPIIKPGFHGTWNSEEGMFECLKEALQTGKPIEYIRDPLPEPENPYKIELKKNPDSKFFKACYEYWEKFHEHVPVECWHRVTLDEIEDSLKTGIPFEKFKPIPGIVY